MGVLWRGNREGLRMDFLYQLEGTFVDLRPWVDELCLIRLDFVRFSNGNQLYSRMRCQHIGMMAPEAAETRQSEFHFVHTNSERSWGLGGGRNARLCGGVKKVNVFWVCLQLHLFPVLHGCRGRNE